jgi:hypothetical protein
MDGSGPAGGLGQTLLTAGRHLERSIRGLRDSLSPTLAWHRLRWRLHSRDYLRDWTKRRLQLDGHYWLFILGLNNSGTTLLVDLLKAHPLVRWLPNEGQYLTGALPLPRSYHVPRNFSRRPDIFHWTEESDPTPALRIQYDWSYYYQRRPGILLEKSPPNIMRSRWLQHCVQPSRFLAIIRHPYAVCEGIRRRDGHPIDEAAFHWVRANECLLEDARQLRDCLLLRYEELCQQPEDHLEKIESFLGLPTPIDRQVLAAPQAIHNIDATPQRIGNLNERSLAQLSAADLACIDQIAGPLMQRLGYEPLRLPDHICSGSRSKKANLSDSTTDARV